MTIVPEIFPSDMGAIANIRPATVRQPRFSKRDKTRMPQTKEDARGKHSLPVGLRGDDVVHQPEELIWVVLNLNVHVELDLLILGLLMDDEERSRGLNTKSAHLHKQLDSLFERGDRLFGFPDCPNVFHTVFSKPVSFFDFTYTAGALANESPR